MTCGKHPMKSLKDTPYSRSLGRNGKMLSPCSFRLRGDVAI